MKTLQCSRCGEYIEDGLKVKGSYLCDDCQAECYEETMYGNNHDTGDYDGVWDNIVKSNEGAT